MQRIIADKLSDNNNDLATIIIGRGAGEGTDKPSKTVFDVEAIELYGKRVKSIDFPNVTDYTELTNKTLEALEYAKVPRADYKVTHVLEEDENFPYSVGDTIGAYDRVTKAFIQARILNLQNRGGRIVLHLNSSLRSPLDIALQALKDGDRAADLGLTAPVDLQARGSDTGGIHLTMNAYTNSRAIGVSIHVSLTQGFTPDISTQYLENGTGNVFDLKNKLAAGSVYYIRAQTFGDRGPDDFSPFSEEVSAKATSLLAEGLAAGSITDLTPFASDIKPVINVNSLPDLPHPNLTEPQMVNLNGTLYEIKDGVWSLAVKTEDLVGQITGDQLNQDILSFDHFPDDLRPVAVVSSLPLLPDEDYPLGSSVSLNGEIYRNKLNVWSDSVPTVKLEGQIVGSQIADSAIQASKIAAGAVSTLQLASNAVATGNIQTLAITAGLLAADSVNSVNIVDDAIETIHINAGAVTASLLANDAVTNVAIAPNAVGTSQLAALAVTAGILAADSVNSVNIIDNAIDSVHISTGAVTANSIATNAVGQLELASNAVGSNELSAFAVTAGKLAADSVNSVNIIDNAIDSVHISTGAVTANSIAPNAVNTLALAPNAVGTNELAALAVTAGILAADSVNSVNIIDDAVNNTHISAGAVTANSVAANAITSTAIAANAIVAGKIAAGTIGADEIAANAITTQKLHVLAKNYVNNWSKTQDVVTGWVRAAGGATASLVKANNNSDVMRFKGTGSSHYVSDHFEIDANKTYRFSASFYKTPSNIGNIYFGVYFYDSAGGVLTVEDIDANTKEVVNPSNGNPYLSVGFRANGSFQEHIGWAVPSTLDSSEFPVSVRSTRILRYPANAATMRMRFWNYGNGNTNASLYVYSPSVIEAHAGEIHGDSIVANTITSNSIVAGTIGANEIAANSIGVSELAANAVTANSIAANAITSTAIAANAIVAGKIAAGTISATEIAANAITTNELSVTAKNLINNWSSTGDYQTGWAVIAGSPTRSLMAASTRGNANVLRFRGSGNKAIWTDRIEIDASKSYRISASFYKPNPIGNVMIGIYVTDKDNTILEVIPYSHSARGYYAATSNFYFDTSLGTSTWKDFSAYAIATGSGANEVPEGKNASSSFMFPPSATHMRLRILDYYNGSTVKDTYIHAPSISEINTGVIHGDSIKANSIAAASIVSNSISSSQIAANSITTSELSANSVTASIIAANAVTANSVAANAITSTAIAANAIVAGKIAAGTIGADEIAANAITTSKLLIAPTTGANLVVDGQTQDASAWTPTSSASPTTIIASSSQHSSKVLKGTSAHQVYSKVFNLKPNTKYRVSATLFKSASATGKFYVRLYQRNASSGVITYNCGLEALTLASEGWDIFTNTITTDNLVRDGYLRLVFNYNQTAGYWLATNLKVEELVTGELIVDGAITASHIVSNSITANEIAANAISVSELAANSVTAIAIATGAVTANSIAANAITSTAIAANAIVAGKIAAGTIGANEIAANAITTQKLHVLAKNYVNNFSSTGNYQDGWFTSAGSPIVSLVVDATRSGAKVLKVSGSGNISRLSDLFEIDSSKAYKFTASFKKSSTVGNIYFGGYVYDASNTLLPVEQYMASNKQFAMSSSNLYFKPYFKTTEWVTVESYILPFGTTPEEFPECKNATYIHIMPEDATQFRMRFLNWANGTTVTELYVHAPSVTEIHAGLIHGDSIVANTITSNSIVAGSITALEIAANTITASQIAANAITVSELAAGSVTANALVANAITSTAIAANAIVSDKIAVGAISADKLAANSVTTRSLVVTNFTNLIPNPNFATGDFSDWNKYGNAAYQAIYAASDYGTGDVRGVSPFSHMVGFAPRASGNITVSTFSHYAEGGDHRWNGGHLGGIQCKGGEQYFASVTHARHSNTVVARFLFRVYFSYGDGTNSYTYKNLGAVSASSIVNGWTESSDAFVVPEGAVKFHIFTYVTFTGNNVYFSGYNLNRKNDANLIVDGSISAQHIVSNTITASQIAVNTLTANEIKANAIGVSELAANAVTANAIAANAVVAGKIAANTISANEIAAGAISTNELSVLAKNLINNPCVSGDTTTGWNGYGSAVNLALNDTYGDIVQIKTAGNVQYSSDYFEIDPSKVYKFTVSMIRGHTGNSYFGCNAINSAGAGLPLTPFSIGNRTFGAATTNPYFWYKSGAFGWTSFVGYIFPHDMDASEAPQGKNVYNSFRMPPNTHRLRVRYLNYYNSSVVHELYLHGMNVQEVGGGKIHGNTIVAESITASEIKAGTITGNKIAANTISADRIAANSITAGQLAANSITTSELSAGSVAATHIQASAVTATAILAGSVTAKHLSVGDFDTLIANGTFDGGIGDVTDPNYYLTGSGSWYYDASVSRSGVNSLVYSTAGQNSSAVVYFNGVYSNPTGQIKVTVGDRYYYRIFAKYAGNAPIVASRPYMGITGVNASGAYQEGPILTCTVVGGWVMYELEHTFTNPATRYVNFNITIPYSGAQSTYFVFDDVYARKMDNGKLIVDGTLHANKIVAGSISADKLVSNSITAGQIAAGAINTSELATGAITAVKIAAGEINSAHINVGTLNADRIVSGTIDSIHMKINSILANAIAPNQVLSGHIPAGQISGGHLQVDSVDATKIKLNGVMVVSDSTEQNSRIDVKNASNVVQASFGDIGGNSWGTTTLNNNTFGLYCGENAAIYLKGVPMARAIYATYGNYTAYFPANSTVGTNHDKVSSYATMSGFEPFTLYAGRGIIALISVTKSDTNYRGICASFSEGVGVSFLINGAWTGDINYGVYNATNNVTISGLRVRFKGSLAAVNQVNYAYTCTHTRHLGVTLIEG